MTPRQQEASSLREQGLTQREIGVEMGIGQPWVSALLDLNRTQYLAIKRHRKSELGRKTHNAYSRKWRRENPEKVKASARLSNRVYYVANREKILGQARKRREKKNVVVPYYSAI